MQPGQPLLLPHSPPTPTCHGMVDQILPGGPGLAADDDVQGVMDEIAYKEANGQLLNRGGGEGTPPSLARTGQKKNQPKKKKQQSLVVADRLLLNMEVPSSIHFFFFKLHKLFPRSLAQSVLDLI